MPKKKVDKKIGGSLVALGIILIGIVGFTSFALGQLSFRQATIDRVAEIIASALLAEEPGNVSLGTASDYCSGDEATTNLCVVDILDLTGSATTTLQEITLGSRYNSALTFTAGSTSTPGGLFSLQNTGVPKICSLAVTEISTADSTGGPTDEGCALDFSVATSTSASAYSHASGGSMGILASTTLATGTTDILNTQDDTVGSGQKTFLWDSGVYLLGTFDDHIVSQGGTGNASSSCYTDMEGEFYVECITR